MSEQTQAAEEEKKEEGGLSESLIGLFLAIFGAVLALAGIGGGKFDGDQFVAASEASKAYAWYQSKSIKNTSLEAQIELLNGLARTGSIQKEFMPALDSFVTKITKKSEKYKKEMNEILKGSQTVGKENWIQDKDGKLGIIVGAQEWEQKVEYLDGVGNWFDLTNLFLNISMVFGALCFIVKNERMKRLFFFVLVISGVIGSILCVYAFHLGFNAP